MSVIQLSESQFKRLISEVSLKEIDAASTEVNVNPTDPQKEAGNYKMAHVYVRGMGISIENPRGSKRRYHKDDGTDGYNIMKHHYGYFRNTSGNGKDGDAVDVFIGPDPEHFDTVWVVDQNDSKGEFDESKVMIGFHGEEEAKNAYLSNYSPDWTGLRCITGVPLKVFKRWLYRKRKQRKPFSDYAYIMKHKHEPETEKQRLDEGSRDNLLLPYVELLKQRGINVNTSMLKTYLLRKFVNEALIRNLSLTSNYYLSGVARYYFNGDLTTNKQLGVFDDDKTKDEFIPEVCERLNALILVLRNSYIDSVGTKWEQTEDFGNLSLTKLFRKYNKAINKELGIEDPKKAVAPKPELDKSDSVGTKGYKFEILYTYDEAKKWNKPTEPGAWCITYGQHHFRSYVRRLGIHYVVFYRPDYQNIPRRKGQGWTKQKPQDEYGNSVICVLQSNKSWEPVFITSRWNHGTGYDNTNCEADHAYTTEEFMQVTGVGEADLERIFKIWEEEKSGKKGVSRTEMNAKAKTIERAIKYIQMRLNSGESMLNVMPKDAFSYYAKYYNKAKVDRIDAELAKTDDETVKDKLWEAKYKEKLKGLVVITTNIDGQTVSFLTDNGNIILPSISYSVPYRDGIDLETCEDRNTTIPNVFVFDMESMAGTKTYLIYDIKKHEIVYIDGVYKFNDVEDLYHNKYPFYAVKKGSSMALLSTGDNIPLMLPNKEYWFEQLYSTGSNYYHPGPTNAPAFQVMYDSAADESFFYSVQDRQWFTPPTPEEGFKASIGTNTWDSFEMGNKTVFEIDYQKNGYYFNNWYIILMDGIKQVNLGGYNTFHEIGKVSGDFIPFTDMSYKVHLINYVTDKEVPIPVEVTRSLYQPGKSYLIEFDDYGLKQHGLSQRIVFDTTRGIFLENPLIGGYWFHIYHNDSDYFTFFENKTYMRYDVKSGEFSEDPNVPDHLRNEFERQ